jgi:uncharacterized membrane protein YccC
MVTGMLRTVGTAWSARRLVRANRSELVALTRQEHMGGKETADQRNRLTAIMMDRLAQLFPRLAAGHETEQAVETELLRLRIGLDVVDVQRLRRGLPAPAAAIAGSLLEGIGAHIGRENKQGCPPPFSLCDSIDRLITAVIGAPESPRISSLILALVGVRRGLFPFASPYRPPQPDMAVPGDQSRSAS